MNTVRLREGARLRVLAVLALGLLLAACATGPLPRGESSSALAPASDGALDAAVVGLALAPDASAYRLVAGAEDAFALRMRTAALAARSLDVQYYMWHDDLTGRLLAGELLAAADRGVRVRVLVDDLYARSLDAALANVDAHPLLEIRVFNPFRSRASVLGNAWEFIATGGRGNHRMHNKLWIADSRLAIVGGRNIGDEYFGAHREFNFGDLGVLLAGEAAVDASMQFDEYWNSESAVPLSAFARAAAPDAALETARSAFAAHRAAAAGSDYAARILRLRDEGALGLGLDALRRGGAVRVLADDPRKAQGGDGPLRMLEEMRALLGRARAEAIVVSPYFVPMRSGTDGLLGLRERGVSVAVLTNSLAANDVAAVHGGYSRWRKPLLRGGVMVHELKPLPGSGGGDVEGRIGSSRASLHTKAVIVDRRLAFVGSFNMDPRSARLNTESGVLIEDPAFAAEVRAHYEQAIAQERSWQVRLVDGRLRWYDVIDGREVQVAAEPGADFSRRFTALLFRLLPLDAQL
ncbi:MAG: phospholipase D family protein [Pseudomonadota bacterium]